MTSVRDTGVTPATAAPASHEEFTIALHLEDGYRQMVDSGLAGVPPLAVDELAPLGAGGGPNPARLLASAVGSCLAARSSVS